MALSVQAQYQDIFHFLEDYRINLSQLRATVPVPGPVSVGDDITIELFVPVLDERVFVSGRVMAPMGEFAGVQLDAEAGDGLPRLEGFFRFVGKLMANMLVSGRVKVTGQWEAGQGPVTYVQAGPGQAPSGLPSSPSAASTGAPMIEAYRDRDLGQPAAQGRLGEVEVTQLWMQLYRERSTGILDIRTSEGRRLAFVKGGGVVQFLADPVIQEECLGVLLTRAGRLTEDQLKKSLALMSQTGQKQGQCLIELGSLTFPQLIVSLITQVEIITRNLMRLTEGNWAWYPFSHLAEEFATPPMKAPGFLFRYFQKRFATTVEAELLRRLEPLMDRYTVLTRDLQWDDLRLKKDERRFIEILGEKSYRFRGVFTVSNLGRGATVQMLMALIELGALTFVDAENAQQTHERWRRQLGTKWDNLEKQNPFEVLEVHWTSRTPHVEAGHLRLRKEYDAFGRGAALPPDVDALRLKIVQKIDAAYAAIKDTGLRQLERKKHYEPQQLDFSADLLFKQAEMLMVRGRWSEVIDNFERAVELMPNSPKYRQFLENAKKQAGSGVELPGLTVNSDGE